MDVAPTTGIEAEASPARSAGDAVARRRRAWTAWAWVLLPALVMAVLGGAAVGRNHSLWYDELYTAEIAPLSPGDLVSAIVRGEGPIPYLRDAPPSYNGPYYLVTHAWLAVTGLEADEVGLRVLSLVAAVAAAVAFTAAACRLAGRRTGVVAGLVLAANPFVVQYAAEARGYTLALLGVSLAALGLARWLDDQPRALLLYGLGGAFAGLLHWFALLVLGGFAVAGFVLRRRRALPLLTATAAAAVPALALVTTALVNGVGGSGAEWLRGVGTDVPRLLLRSWAGRNTALLALSVVLALTGLVLARGSRARVVGAAWFGVPVVAVTLLELARPVFVDRYLLATVPGLAVLVALGISRLPARAAAAAATAAVLAATAWAAVIELGRPPKEDIRAAVAYVAARHVPGEPVVAPARWDALGVDYYSGRDHDAMAPDSVLAPATFPDAPRVWVVRRASGGVIGDVDKLNAFEAELIDRGMRRTDERRFDGRYTDTLVQRWVADPASAADGAVASGATG